MGVIAVAKGDAAKSVPLRFVLPIVAGWNFVCRPGFHRRQRRLYDEGHPLGYRRGASFGGRFPLSTAPATEMYRSSVRSAAQRNIKPPRLMSPRPTKSAGKRKRVRVSNLPAKIQTTQKGKNLGDRRALLASQFLRQFELGAVVQDHLGPSPSRVGWRKQKDPVRNRDDLTRHGTGNLRTNDPA